MPRHYSRTGKHVSPEGVLQRTAFGTSAQRSRLYHSFTDQQHVTPAPLSYTLEDVARQELSNSDESNYLP